MLKRNYAREINILEYTESPPDEARERYIQAIEKSLNNMNKCTTVSLRSLMISGVVFTTSLYACAISGAMVFNKAIHSPAALNPTQPSLALHIAKISVEVLALSGCLIVFTLLNGVHSNSKSEDLKAKSDQVKKPTNRDNVIIFPGNRVAVTPQVSLKNNSERSRQVQEVRPFH